MNPYLQIFLTVVSGVIVFVLGQIIIRFIIEPVHDIKIQIREIFDDLTFYSNIYCNPGTAKNELMNETSDKLRKNASKLRAYSNSINFYKINKLIFHIPNKDNINIAYHGLIGLSNSIFQGDPLRNSDTADKVKVALGFPAEEK